MTEVLLPTWIIPEEETHEWLDEGSSVFGAAFAPGLVQRQSYGGLRLKLSRRHTVRGEEKAQLLSILKATRGRYNALRTKVHFALRGSGLGGELITNSTFANGSTGFAASGSLVPTLAVQDRVARLSYSTIVIGAGGELSTSSSVAVTQYAPNCFKAFLRSRSLLGSNFVRLGATAGANTYGQVMSSVDGLVSGGFVPYAATAFPTALATAAAGNLAGDYLEVPYLSLARCALVDNGQSLLVRSDEFDSASWTKSGATIQTNAVAAPDGATAGDGLTEDGANSQHTVAQNFTTSGAVADMCFGVALRPNARNWVELALTENTGSTSLRCYFDTQNGVTGTTATGANWASLRTFMVNLGDGWYACYLIGRKTNAASSLTATILAASANGTNSYAGSSIAHHMWRATLSLSSVPSKLALTTSASLSPGVPQTGVGITVKGLPASTNGLLLAGDWFEVGGEIKQASSALNSNAAGLGFIPFEPALVRSPTDNDPLSITDPMGKFLVSNIKIENQFGTQATVTYDLEHIYE